MTPEDRQQLDSHVHLQSPRFCIAMRRPRAYRWIVWKRLNRLFERNYRLMFLPDWEIFYPNNLSSSR